MKKVFAMIAIASFMVACGNKADNKEGENKDSANKMEMAAPGMDTIKPMPAETMPPPATDTVKPKM